MIEELLYCLGYNRYKSFGGLGMPYDIRQNYRGKSGYSVVGPDGTIRGTHKTKREAIEQQRALYAAENETKKDFWNGFFAHSNGKS